VAQKGEVEEVPFLMCFSLLQLERVGDLVVETPKDQDQGSGIRDQGSGIKDQGSRIKDHGSRIMDQGSWIKDHGSRIRTKVQNEGSKIVLCST